MFQVRSRKSMLLLVCLTLVLSSVGYLYTSVQRNSRVMMLKTDIVQSEKEKLLKTIVQTSDKLSTFILIASPSVVKGSELRKTIGFKASESVFSPTKALYVPPVLPQSALINSLKLNPQIELIGQLQAYLESFSQLLVPNQKQFRQIQRNNSVLWNNLKINAQRAAGIFVYNQRTLEKEGEEDLQNDILFQLLQNNLLALVKIAKTADSLACLRIVEDAMNNLLAIANMKSLEKQICRTNYMLLHDGESDGSSSVSSSYSTNISYAKGTVHEVTIMVDGTNYPITAGNFVDLCNKRFYDTLPIASRSLEVGGEVVPLTVLGEYSPGYVDPVTQKQRRLPLEVLREGATRSSEVYAVAPPYQGSSNALRYTATGGSLNSAVFTKAKPVQSFATYGAIGMFHPPGDLNGASSSIFWCPLAGPLPSSSSVGVNVEEVQRKRGQLRRQALLGQLDGRYALFGYVLRGAEVLSRLRPEDLVLRAAVVMSEGQGDCSGENYEGDGGDTHLQAGDAHGKCIWRLNPGD